jgi:hypothetical protein
MTGKHPPATPFFIFAAICLNLCGFCGWLAWSAQAWVMILASAILGLWGVAAFWCGVQNVINR